ncbi:hypothetical protein K432DRAFT_306678 [Lepidopterella palustris CBS 459.81]|uniref:Uncharacterized protein n=1 Tax=Lepidopterella palustris CBS 459.81 TaxID=1314670 RepID=A0A8E2E330_9PEZI|nr:hypothetical protein K432DRAFT_306678 [Lepidopterella palustris CBS 459.81]
MPHKHKRKAGDDSVFNLPPTSRAKPLPVTIGKSATKATTSTARNARRNKLKEIDGYGADDTPKAFARLMQFHAAGRGPKGLDNGDRPNGSNKKRKLNPDNASPDNPKAASAAVAAVPQIMPGERLSDFSARVNHALPISGLANRGKGVKDRVTKHEKKLKRLQDGWRKEEARIREKEEEERELAEEEADEHAAMWEDKTADLPAGRKSKKGRRGKVVGEWDDDDGDPWEVLRVKRGGHGGLHDVVQAPPELGRAPREAFKVRDGARVEVGHVPNKAGSLRRREELGEERKSIIESYRRIMGERRIGI